MNTMLTQTRVAMLRCPARAHSANVDHGLAAPMSICANISIADENAANRNASEPFGIVLAR